MLIGLHSFGVVMILSSFSYSFLKMSCFDSISRDVLVVRAGLQTVCYVPMQVVSGSKSEMRYPFLYQRFFHFVKPYDVLISIHILNGKLSSYFSIMLYASLRTVGEDFS
jgi:hypothetical protein